MTGMDAKTGKRLSGLEHLRQSIKNCLTTPMGTRRMLMEYGSRLFGLVDSPINPHTVMDLQSAVTDSITQWEPRVEVIEVTIQGLEPGQVALMLKLKDKETGQNIAINHLALFGAFQTRAVSN